ncbi:flagellar protein FlgJ [Pseudoduganella lurida]|uniref:Flagellar protein FlgJ n=1 Tax=Pseudoduganella lurida TaxID=1036180 RepID=A0A562RFD9_9BURK|nr:rod-binding protein [Pseudoduganella lurida]TWI67613.1 flagellar protein FlgJ [Pseudoduganella lurida]
MDARLPVTSATSTTAGAGLDPAAEGAPQVAPADSAYHRKATEAAIKFESFFIGHMLKQMRSSTKELSGDDSIYKDSVNSDMLDMADNLVADQMAHQRAFGVADAILRQLIPAAPPPPAAPMPAGAVPSAQKSSAKT